MNNVYSCTLTPSSTKQYLKLSNTLQLVMFYQEYCNVTLINTNKLIDSDIANIDAQITAMECKLTASKQKLIKYHTAIKQYKHIPKPTKSIQFGCHYCEILFTDTIDLDNHMAIHKQADSYKTQLLMMNQLMGQQLLHILKCKQDRKDLELMEQDLQYGIKATAELEAILQSDDQINLMEQQYRMQINQTKLMLEELKSVAIKPHDDITEFKDVIDVFGRKLQQQAELQRQKQQAAIVQPQEISVVKSVATKKSAKLKELLKLKQQQEDILPKELKQHPQELQMIKDDDNTNSDYVSLANSSQLYDQLRMQRIQANKQFQIKKEEFNKQVKLIMFNRYFGKTEVLSQSALDAKISQVKVEFSQDDPMEDLEEQLKKLQKQNYKFHLRPKDVKRHKQNQQQQQLESITSSDEEQSQSSDQGEQEAQEGLGVPSFPFKINEEDLINESDDDEEQQEKGYGVNTFSINY